LEIAVNNNQRIAKIGMVFFVIGVVWMVLNQFSIREVQLAEVRRGLIQDTLELSGQVDMAQKAVVCSKHNGIVTTLHVAVGRQVAAEEELLRLHLENYNVSLEKVETAYQAAQAKVASLQKAIPVQVKQAELRLLQAQTIVEQARVNWEEVKARRERAEQSDGADLVTATRLKKEEEQAETVMTEATRQMVAAERNLQLLQKALTPRELLTAEAELKQLGFEVAQLRQSRGEIGVLTMMGGSVLKNHVTVGARIRTGERLVEVGNYQSAYIRAKVPAGQAAKIRSGQKVLISGAALGKKIIDGTVLTGRTEKSAASTSVQGQLQVKYDYEHVILKYGSRVKLKVVTGAAENGLYIPAAAVFKRFGQPYVFVVESGKAMLRRVRPGINGNSFVEIKRGLFVGEQVVVSPGLTLRPGRRVKAGGEW
jgi:HlyD family secretion protein